MSEMCLISHAETVYFMQFLKDSLDQPMPMVIYCSCCSSAGHMMLATCHMVSVL